MAVHQSPHCTSKSTGQEHSVWICSLEHLLVRLATITWLSILPANCTGT